MKIKMMIATSDKSYVDHLSNVLTEKYIETFEVSVCSSLGNFGAFMDTNQFDIVLLEPEYISFLNPSLVRLPLLLWDESVVIHEESKGFRKIRKYQRISSIASQILESYAEISKGVHDFDSCKSHITAVWSPCGGVGKTTVSLAFAARKILDGKKAVYLNLENFSSTPVYFPANGKSISSIFDKLESNSSMILMSIRQQDNSTGISYFCGPDNYDDISILTENDIEMLIQACATETEELIIDLSSQCDKRIQKVFALADTILLVCDTTSTSDIKLKQFMGQHNVFQQIQSKIVFVNNKGAKKGQENETKVIQLPYVQSVDPISIYKTLSASNLEW